jgi:mycoredoxin
MIARDVVVEPASSSIEGARVTTEPTAAPTSPVQPDEGSIVMYSTTWCGYCRRLRSQLDSAGIGYTVVDIEQQPETAAYVEQINGGNQTVPTVVFPDGSAATNPSLAQVKAALGV